MQERLINSPAAGFGYAFQGLRLISRPGLRRYVVIPFLVNVVVFTLLIWLGVDQFEILLDHYLPQEGWLSYFRWLLWPLFAVALLLVIFYSFTLIANLLAAPFNDMLAAKVEAMLSGSPPDEGPGGIMAAVGPAVRSELQKIAYFLPRALPLLVLFIVPGINAVAPFIWALFSAWSLALEYTEYPFGNNGFIFARQRRLMKARRLTSLGFGGGVMLMMLIPGLNFLAMPSAVAGATALWVERLKQAAQNAGDK